MHSKKLVFGIFLGSIFFIKNAHSQSDNSDSLRAETLEEVTINAIRAAESAPVAKVTVSKKEIEQVYTGQDGAFLLDDISPSIVSYSESGTGLSNYGQMRLRGIDQTRINITLNGVPLNDMIDQGVFFSNFTDFGNSIQSVQIQRGVGTSTNGVASYAGSVNFESVSLTRPNPAAEVQLTGGSFGTARGSFETHTGLMDNNFAFYSRLTHTQSDGYRYGTSTNSQSLFFSGGYFGEKHALKLTGFAGRSRNGLAYLPVALSDIKNDPKTNYISRNDVDDFGQYLMQLQHTFRTSKKSSLVSTVYYGGAGGDFPFGLNDDDGNFFQINYPLYNDHLGAMSVFSGLSRSGNTDFSAGAHGYLFYRNNWEYIIPNRENPYYNDSTRKSEAAVFAKIQHRINRLELFADAQLRAVRLSFFPDEGFLGRPADIPDFDYLFFNPKVGATFRASDNWQFYISYGRSGREPTRFPDLLGSTQINATNIDLIQDEDRVKPEFVNDFEGGARFSNTKLQVNTNLFFIQFENEIAPIGPLVDQGFGRVSKNQKSSYRAGIEVDGNWDFAEKWRIAGHATYMRARISSFQPEDSNVVFDNITPILSPEWIAQASLQFSPIEKLQFSATANYLSESFLELTNREDLIIPESFVLDLAARWNFWREHSLSVQFNNILDELYYTSGAPTTDLSEPAYFVQPPRHLYVTLRLRF